MTQMVEVEADDVGTATHEGLAQLGIGADDALVEVVSQGATPVPGEQLSSSRTVVRVSRVEPHIAQGRDLLVQLLDWMQIPARVSLRRAAGSGREGAPLPPVILDVAGDDLGLLIGWRGETLRALQTVLNLMVDQAVERSETGTPRLIVDVERYRARREDHVRELALRLASRVRRSGERYTLDPMHAYERRIVHIALEDDPSVRVESIGEEPARRIVIHPTGPAQGGYDRGDRYGSRRSSWRNRDN